MARKRNKAKKHEDLQPWLDYFQMFREYVNTGMLQMVVKDHECFIIQSALHAISEGDVVMQMQDGSLEKTATRLRTYAAWLSGEGYKYNKVPFAVNVLKSNEPYEPLYTILLTEKHKFFKIKTKIEFIVYNDRE